MASRNSFILLLFCLTACAPSLSKNLLGDLIPLCDRTSPTLNDCVKESTNKLIPKLKNGVREADFPPLDPLRIPVMNIGEENGAVYLKMEITDTVHTGFSTVRVTSVNLDMNSLVWIFTGTLPRYTLTGDYTAKGRILLVPLGGAGIANFTLQDLDVTLVVKGGKKMIKGQEHFDVKEAKATFVFIPGKNYLDIHRTMGDLTLAEQTRQFLKQNADEVFGGIKSSIEEVYTDIFTGLLRRLFNKLPLNQIFKN